MPKISPWNWFKTICAVVALLIILFFIIEIIMAAVVLPIHKQSKFQNWISENEALNRSWTLDYLENEDKIGFDPNTVEYAPYIVFRHKNYTSAYINIGADGNRQTLNPCAGSESKKIFIFGGSAAWGITARDNYTIPSFLSSELCKRGFSVNVTNMAEMGYVSTQDILKFMLELRDGDKPDVAIFYWGGNDVYSAYEQGGVAGLAGENDNRKFELNLRHRFNIIQPLLSSNTWKAISRFLPHPPPKANMSDDEIENLADNVIQVCRYNADFAKSIGHAAQVLFFLQPMVETKSILTETEKRISSTVPPSEYVLFKRTYSKMRQELVDNVSIFDISGSLDTANTTIFRDEVHLVEEGNQLVAERMADVLEKLL